MKYLANIPLVASLMLLRMAEKLMGASIDLMLLSKKMRT